MIPRPSYLGLWLIVAALAFVALVTICPNAVGIAICVGFWLLLAAGVFVVAFVVFWLIRNQLSPVVRVPARVVRRRMKEWDVTLTQRAPIGIYGRDARAAWHAWSYRLGRENVAEAPIVEGKDYYVTFDFEGREMEFSVSEDDYVQADENVEGLLVYRGEQFRHFIPGVF